MASFSNTRERFGIVEISTNGHIDSRDTKVKNVKYPTENGDATNKLYVDRFNNVGDIKMSVRSSDFYGWIKCDGRSISRVTYPQLFSVIGTSFGSSDGDSFNLPDCRGRVLGTLGQGPGLTNRTLGQNPGEETHTMTTAEMPSHTHTGTTGSSGEHSHAITDPGHRHIWNYGLEGDDSGEGGSNAEFTTAAGPLDPMANATTGITINSDGAHTHAFTTNPTGNSNAFNVMQPTIFIANTFIYSGNEN